MPIVTQPPSTSSVCVCVFAMRPSPCAPRRPSGRTSSSSSHSSALCSPSLPGPSRLSLSGLALSGLALSWIVGVCAVPSSWSTLVWPRSPMPAPSSPTTCCCTARCTARKQAFLRCLLLVEMLSGECSTCREHRREQAEQAEETQQQTVAREACLSSDHLRCCPMYTMFVCAAAKVESKAAEPS